MGNKTDDSIEENHLTESGVSNNAASSASPNPKKSKSVSSKLKGFFASKFTKQSKKSAAAGNDDNNNRASNAAASNRQAEIEIQDQDEDN